MSADNKIAYQGVPGAYSHKACVEAYPDMDPVACESFEDAFAAVADGRARLAMIPIENSVGGRVADIHHLLPDSGLYIIDEHFQSVQHQLLAVEGATLETIENVTSHVQALSQCRHLIAELNLKPVQSADTAGAAKQLAESGDQTTAAIASQLAGEIYGLKVLRSRIEDRIGNTTRMVVMSRQRVEPDPSSGPCMTSLVFQVRSVPAACTRASADSPPTVSTSQSSKVISLTPASRLHSSMPRLKAIPQTGMLIWRWMNCSTSQRR